MDQQNISTLIITTREKIEEDFILEIWLAHHIVMMSIATHLHLKIQKS